MNEDTTLTNVIARVERQLADAEARMADSNALDTRRYWQGRVDVLQPILDDLRSIR